MIRLEGNLPYAAARVHARHSLRPDESAWRRIEARRHLGQYLEALRASALAPWVASIEVAHDTHAIERTLRGEWRGYVRALASWHPRKWQAWFEWWCWRPALPLLARLARAEPVPSWMLADPVFGPVAVGSPGERGAALETTPLAPLAAAVRGERSVGSAWLEHAARLVPPLDLQSRDRLSLLMRLAAGSVAGPARDSEAALLRLFRAASDTAIASGCHLALLALELERLRGGLVVRSLFDTPSAEAA